MKMNFLILFYLIDIFMLLIILMSSNLFKFHPLIFSMMLFLYTMLICIKMNYLLTNFWYSYILFLIMIGGVMILILYFTSISSNELINFNLKYFINLVIKTTFMLILFFYFFMYFKYYYLNNFFMKNFELNNLSLLFKENFYILKNLYMNPNMEMNIFFIMYMLLMMMSTTMICFKFNVPMRQMIF